jgi:hypothetical protein
MDPYIKVKWEENGEKKEYKTKVCQEAGKTPKWGSDPTDENSIQVRVEDMFTQYIEFNVKDEGTMSNTDIGSFEIDYSALCFNYGVDQWFRLMFKNVNAGQLRLITEYVDDESPKLTADDIISQTEQMKIRLKELKTMESHEDCPDVNTFIPIDLSDSIRRGGLTVTGVEGFDNGEKVEKVCTVRNADHDKLCANMCDDFFIQYEFVKPILIRGYGISSANDRHNRDPKSWEFQIKEINVHTGEELHDGDWLTFA